VTVAFALKYVRPFRPGPRSYRAGHFKAFASPLFGRPRPLPGKGEGLLKRPLFFSLPLSSTPPSAASSRFFFFPPPSGETTIGTLLADLKAFPPFSLLGPRIRPFGRSQNTFPCTFSSNKCESALEGKDSSRISSGSGGWGFAPSHSESTFSSFSSFSLRIFLRG